MRAELRRTMLTIFGGSSYGGFCDRIARRDFLAIGGMALGGLALLDLLRAEAQPNGRAHKAIINIYLPGGPPRFGWSAPRPRPIARAITWCCKALRSNG